MVVKIVVYLGCRYLRVSNVRRFHGSVIGCCTHVSENPLRVREGYTGVDDGREELIEEHIDHSKCLWSSPLLRASPPNHKLLFGSASKS